MLSKLDQYLGKGIVKLLECLFHSGKFLHDYKIDGNKFGSTILLHLADHTMPPYQGYATGRSYHATISGLCHRPIIPCHHIRAMPQADHTMPRYQGYATGPSYHASISGLCHRQESIKATEIYCKTKGKVSTRG